MKTSKKTTASDETTYCRCSKHVCAPQPMSARANISKAILPAYQEENGCLPCKTAGMATGSGFTGATSRHALRALCQKVRTHHRLDVQSVKLLTCGAPVSVLRSSYHLSLVFITFSFVFITCLHDCWFLLVLVNFPSRFIAFQHVSSFLWIRFLFAFVEFWSVSSFFVFQLWFVSFHSLCLRLKYALRGMAQAQTPAQAITHSVLDLTGYSNQTASVTRVPAP